MRRLSTFPRGTTLMGYVLLASLAGCHSDVENALRRDLYDMANHEVSCTAVVQEKRTCVVTLPAEMALPAVTVTTKEGTQFPAKFEVSQEWGVNPEFSKTVYLTTDFAGESLNVQEARSALRQDLTTIFKEAYQQIEPSRLAKARNKASYR